MFIRDYNHLIGYALFTRSSHFPPGPLHWNRKPQSWIGRATQILCGVVSDRKTTSLVAVFEKSSSSSNNRHQGFSSHLITSLYTATVHMTLTFGPPPLQYHRRPQTPVRLSYLPVDNECRALGPLHPSQNSKTKLTTLTQIQLLFLNDKFLILIFTAIPSDAFLNNRPTHPSLLLSVYSEVGN